MRIVASKPRSQIHARLATEHIYADGHCIELYYMIKGTSMLQVKIRGEDFIEHQLGAAFSQVIIL